MPPFTSPALDTEVPNPAAPTSLKSVVFKLNIGTPPVCVYTYTAPTPLP